MFYLLIVLPYTGPPFKGLPFNGLPFNGLPFKGLPFNGLPFNGLPFVREPEDLRLPPLLVNFIFKCLIKYQIFNKGKPLGDIV